MMQSTVEMVGGAPPDRGNAKDTRDARGGVVEAGGGCAPSLRLVRVACRSCGKVSSVSPSMLFYLTFRAIR
jgi:hypothetical protein